MRTKTVVTGVLLLFVGVSVAYLVARETRDDTGVPDRTAGRTEAAGRSGEERTGGSRAGERRFDEVIVYYFHGNVRCATCRSIEAYAEEAIRANFADELASGKVKWRSVNVDESENSHFVQDYRLVTRSLVLVGMENDVQTEWTNLDKVWQLVRSKPQFTDYVVETTRKFMGGMDG